MKKWIALILVVIAFTATARALTEAGEVVDSTMAYPYWNSDYPSAVLFKGVAMTKSEDTYPALLLATGFDENVIWEDDDAKFFFILNGEVHEMELDSIERDKGAIIAELSGDGNLVLLIRYQSYWNQVSVSGVYNGKYLLNLGPASNEPVYRIMEALPAGVEVDSEWISDVTPKVQGSGSAQLPEESETEEIWG